MKNSYEIEIKALLGDKKNAENLINKLYSKYPHAKKVKAGEKQLNHYFTKGDKEKLFKTLEGVIEDKAKVDYLRDILKKATKLSVRTRLAKDKAIFVIKTSIDDTTADNGTARMEFEHEMDAMTLDELDNLLLGADFDYQAKWSRERDEHSIDNIAVTIDKNAGYGYLAEFEIVENDPSLADSSKERLRNFMRDLDVEELPQDRLERMFKFYNENWPKYYGTEDIFVVE